jgi:hypothetical protein
VSLITDIVRCAVQFETASDMRTFVLGWIMKYGIAHRKSTKAGWLARSCSETRKFFRIFGEYCRRAEPIPDTRDAEADDIRYDMLASTSDEDFKLFEIHRVRNRMDPDLIDVPGGYRDVAFKLKIGFVRFFVKYSFEFLSLFDCEQVVVALTVRDDANLYRLPESGLARILPVQMWTMSTLRPKFIIVEIQLLLQLMKSDERMHQNYANMRDKMTN